MVPVSDLELSLHAAKEGGYALERITVIPYGSELEIAAVSFVGSWWRRTEVRVRKVACACARAGAHAWRGWLRPLHGALLSRSSHVAPLSRSSLLAWMRGKLEICRRSSSQVSGT